MAVLPPPITATRSPTGTVCSGTRVNLLDEIQRLDHFGQVLAGNSEPEPWPQTHAHEDGIKLLLDLLGGNVPANLNAAPELDSQALNEFYLLQADLRYHLIVGSTPMA